MKRPDAFRAVLIGAGKIGLGYARDPVMARHYPFATHAQVLAAHPEFDWVAAVDPADDARREAQGPWEVPWVAASTRELPAACRPEVAILATPPARRIEALEGLDAVRALLVEKPLGRNPREAADLLAYCQRRGIAVQVNFWRRADEGLRALAAGGLVERIGAAQAAFGVYGNGLANNGIHLIDLCRMLLGEVRAVQAVGPALPGPAGPLPDDVNLPFALRLHSGMSVLFHPIRFSHYRENALEIWGERGKLALLQEGLGVHAYPMRANRAMSGEREVDSDSRESLPATVGQAFYRMYGNLAAHLRGQGRGQAEDLWAPAEIALTAERIREAILTSAGAQGRVVEVAEQT